MTKTKNVLTCHNRAGGGGKTKHRQDKIREKNKKLDENRSKRIEKEKTAKVEGSTNKTKDHSNGGIHPARLAMMNPGPGEVLMRLGHPLHSQGLRGQQERAHTWKKRWTASLRAGLYLGSTGHISGLSIFFAHRYPIIDAWHHFTFRQDVVQLMKIVVD